MFDWIERLRSLVRTDVRADRAPETPQSRRVAAALDHRGSAGDVAWLDAVTAAIGEGPVDPRTLELLVEHLGAGPDADADPVAYLDFWRRLWARDPEDPVLAAHLARAEVGLGDAETGLRRYVDAFDRQPELFYEFGWYLEDIPAPGEGGYELLSAPFARDPDLRFRWQLHQLRWYLHSAAEHGEVGDDARELYGALLDEHRDDPDRLARLRELGDELRRLEAAGVLPRAMVVRQRRRRSREP